MSRKSAHRRPDMPTLRPGIERGLSSVLALFLIVAPGHGAEVVWLDGRRETVKRIVVKPDHLLVANSRGLQRLSKRRVVQARDNDGKAIVLRRELRDAPLDEALRGMLAALPGTPPEKWPRAQEQLADAMSRAVMQQLIGLTKDKRPETRARAGTVLLMMGIESPLRAGLSVAQQDKDKGVRRALASTLFQVAGALRAARLADTVAQGLADRDAIVKTSVALALGRMGDQRALPVLKAGLKNRDHHVRESVAEALAELGSDAGVGVLIRMLSRRTHPAGPSLPKRLVIEEKIRMCDHLGRLRSKKAISALKKAGRSKNPELAAAAKRALDAVNAK